MSPEDISTLEQKLRAACRLDLMLEFDRIRHRASPHAVESALMAKANEKRQREFYSGRYLARKALQRAGVAPVGLGRGDLGNPVWPPGCFGSITHDQQWAAAIAVKDSRLLGLGIDLLEYPETVTDDLSSVILCEPERAILSRQFPALLSTGVAFSLKESVVKAVSVFSGHFLDLLDIKLTLANNCLVAQVAGIPEPVHCRVYPTPCGLVTFSFFLKKRMRYTTRPQQA